MKPKEILVVTNYFPPERGAASNRIFSLVDQLQKNHHQVTVVCPFPNYPHGTLFDGFKGKIYQKKSAEFGTIHRLWVWPSNSSNTFIRLLSMISFSISLVFFFLFRRSPKKVIIQYSPIFVGFTAVFWSRLLGKKVVLNVSDLWPLAGLEMGLLQKGFYYNLLTKMEHYCYRKSQLIIGQSQEILDHVKQKQLNIPLFLYRNFPDFKPAMPTKRTESNEIKIVYAGLLGVAQGLHSICSKIEWPEHISLHLYGTGPEKEAIQQLESKHIVYHGEIERKLLHIELQKYDLALIPLVKRIYGSVPSKIFELARIGLPLLYFAGGEGEQLVLNHHLGWNVAHSDTEALQTFITEIQVEQIEKFSKVKIQETALKNFSLDDQFEKFNMRLEEL